jgi:UDP-glucose:(heptosyl)LPS alpha-1,3-glucosyltransferase
LKIALAFPGCHRRGGVERVMLECANYLVTRGHETHVYSSDWDVKSMDSAILRHHVPISRRPNVARVLSFARGSSRALRAMQPPPHIIGGFGIAAPCSEVVWVQSVQKAWIEISSGQRDFKGRLKQRLNPFHPLTIAMEQRYYGGRRYRKLVALSDQVKNDLVRLYGVPPQDIVVIPNGFAPAEFNPARRDKTRDATRAQLGYRETDRVVIFAANELERKGFGPLLRAIASLQDSRVHLLAVGRLSATAYAAEIVRLGMTDRVHFTGPTSDVAGYYAAADVFALPTQYEAWGLVIVEAMACGLPALTSPPGGRGHCGAGR